MNILFYVEPLIEQDKPYWKDYWVNVVCKNIIETLQKSDTFYNFRLITNEPLSQVAKVNIPIIAMTQKELLAPFDTTNYLDVTSAWHLGAYTQEHLDSYKNLLRQKLDHFIPDIVITFSPVPFLKNMFPRALILHHEYSLFSRSPYPQSWFLDPIGMHSNLFLNTFQSQIKNLNVTNEQKKLLGELKTTCQHVMTINNPLKDFFYRKKEQFEFLVLVPLQFSRYYLFDDLTPFKSQYEYCVYLLDRIPKNIGVVVNMHPEYPVLSKEAVQFLQVKYPHFIFDALFNSIHASGQFILPFVDAVITVSSSLGLQTLLFDKKLITLGKSCFEFAADATSLDVIDQTLHNTDTDKSSLLYFILTRYAMTKHYLHHPQWLSRFLERSLTRYRDAGVDFSFYDAIDSDETLFDALQEEIQKQSTQIPQYTNTPLMQLVYDPQEDFAEKEFLQLPIHLAEGAQEQEFVFALSEKPSQCTLRLDVFNDACVLVLHELKLIRDDGHAIDLMSHISANHLIRHGNNFFFNTHNPQIYFDPNVNVLNNVKALTCKMQFVHTGKDAIEVCLKQLQDDYNHANSLKQADFNAALMEVKLAKMALETAQTEFNETLRALEVAKNDLNLVEEQLDLAEAEVTSLRVKLDAATAELTSTQTNWNLAVLQLNTTQVEYEKTKNELDVTKTDLNLVKIALTATQAELPHMASELAATKARLASIMTELSSNQIKFEETEAELTLTKRELNTVKVELASLYASASCRVTKPFRDIISLLKIEKGRWSMKNKLKKLLHVIKVAKERPDWRQKFFAEIKHNGIKAALNKVKAKSVVPLNVELRPSLVADTKDKEILNFPMVHEPLVSIVIPVYNQFDFTYKCLKSILENTDTVTYEIIIADDVSNDETINLASYAKNITIVRNKKNLGFLLNCNHAAKCAKGQYIHFLNNDTQVQKEWLSSLVVLMQSNEKIGMVGSKLVYPDGRLQEAGGIIWKDASGWNYGRLDDPMKPEYNYVKEVDYISGASIMIKKSLWDEIGGFDKRYVPAYYEDADLAFEVRKRNYQVVYEPKSVVVHFEGISNGTDTQSGIKHYQVKNHEKFFKKWQAVLEQEHFDNATNVFLARDRSHNRAHLLFIDHYLPHYDCDAGSKATYQYLKGFVKNGINVKFLGDNFYDYPGKPYKRALESLGIEVLQGVYYRDNWQAWLKEYADQFDYFIVSRPHIAIKYIDLIKQYSHAKIIYFGVDLHYLREEREYSVKKDEALLHHAAQSKKLELSVMRNVDMSIFYSNIEVDELHKEDPSIHASCAPLYIFDTFKSPTYDAKKRCNFMFVGGFVHAPNVDAMQWFIAEIWPSVQANYSDAKLFILGSNPPKSILNLASDNIIVTGFVSDETLEEYFQQCRLLVAPLRFGAGIKGKIVQSLYEGLPVVTTSIGSEGLMDADHCMVVSDTAEEMANKIIHLYENYDELNRLSMAGNEYCKKNFSESSMKLKMHSIIPELQVETL